MTTLVQLRRHLARLSSCDACPDMIRPVVTGQPVMSPVMLIGQAPGVREGPAGKPFAWTAGKTLFGWFAELGLHEEEFRSRVYMAAVCRCFPGKAASGGDRVPTPVEVQQCSGHLHAEVKLLKPRLIIPVGKLAIAQLYPAGRSESARLRFGPDVDRLADIVGQQRSGQLAGHACDVIALPHPSGASTWHYTEPGKTLLARALAQIGKHEAWRALLAAGATTPAARGTPRRPTRDPRA